MVAEIWSRIIKKYRFSGFLTVIGAESIQGLNCSAFITDSPSLNQMELFHVVAEMLPKIRQKIVIFPFFTVFGAEGTFLH